MQDIKRRHMFAKKQKSFVMLFIRGDGKVLQDRTAGQNYMRTSKLTLKTHCH